MRIGYDAKRLFFNGSGLGNYSRSLVEAMTDYYPEDRYVLFTPKAGNPCGFPLKADTEVVAPKGFVDRKLPSLWRSMRMGRSIREQGIDLFHGLSNELPADIRRSGARSVVTMHDIIFVHMPELYTPADRRLYTRKYRGSCLAADRIIAISRQTKDDLVNLWHLPEEKIDIVYQGCNPVFHAPAEAEMEAAVRAKYGLPARYLLSVGTIEERKNLMLTVRAMVRSGIDIDLVACGRATPYAEKIRAYVERHGISARVHFLHGVTLDELPILYRQAEALVYASFYEGFGIPILEAFESRIPVITTRGGVFPETGGGAALYVDPRDVDEMAEALREVLEKSTLRAEMIEKGARHALDFRQEAVVRNVRAVYEKIV